MIRHVENSQRKESLSFYCSMKEEKIKPIVIGGAKKPRCFKNKNLLALNITYLSNKKSWMTLQTFNFWSEDLNQKIIN
jgi:hypothetical protein